MEKKIISFEQNEIKIELVKILSEENEFLYYISKEDKDNNKYRGFTYSIVQAMDITNRLIEQVRMVN